MRRYLSSVDRLTWGNETTNLTIPRLAAAWCWQQAFLILLWID